MSSGEFAVTAKPDGTASAKGTLQLPLNEPLFILAEVKAVTDINNDGTKKIEVVSSATAKANLTAAANQSIRLVLMPTAATELATLYLNHGFNTLDFELRKSVLYDTTKIAKFDLPSGTTGVMFGFENAPQFIASQPADLKIQLRDSNGRVLFSSAYEPPSGPSVMVTYPVSNLTPGLYYLVLTYAGATPGYVSGQLKIVPFDGSGPDTPQPSILVATSKSKAYYSTDEGQTWLPSGGTPLGLDYGKDMVCYKPQGSPTGLFIAAGSKRHGTINYLGMASYTYSKDGINWVAVQEASNLPQPDGNFTTDRDTSINKLAVNPRGEVMALASSSGNGDTRFYAAPISPGNDSNNYTPEISWTTLLEKPVAKTKMDMPIDGLPEYSDVIGPVWIGDASTGFWLAGQRETTMSGGIPTGNTMQFYKYDGSGWEGTPFKTYHCNSAELITDDIIIATTQGLVYSYEYGSTLETVLFTVEQLANSSAGTPITAPSGYSSAETIYSLASGMDSTIFVTKNTSGNGTWCSKVGNAWQACDISGKINSTPYQFTAATASYTSPLFFAAGYYENGTNRTFFILKSNGPSTFNSNAGIIDSNAAITEFITALAYAPQ